jgi:hypothetical protein
MNKIINNVLVSKNSNNIVLDTQTCVSGFISDLNQTLLFTSLNNENLNLVDLIKFNIKNILNEVLFDVPYNYKISYGTNGVISIIVNYFLIFNIDIIYEMYNDVPIYIKYDYTIDCEKYVDNIEYINVLMEYFKNKDLHTVLKKFLDYLYLINKLNLHLDLMYTSYITEFKNKLGEKHIYTNEEYANASNYVLSELKINELLNPF